MALSQNNKVLWNDIQNIYASLNEAKDYLEQTRINIPQQPLKPLPQEVTDLKTAIESCDANKYIEAAGAAETGITVPSSGNLLYPDIFAAMNNTIATIKNTCLHDAAWYTGNHGFSSFSMNMFHSNKSNITNFQVHNSF